MNLRKRLKRKRACWAKMARANCKLYGIPFKTFLTWDELPDGYKEGNDFRDVMFYVHHYCPGLLMISPYLKETDFTPVEGV
jgi:hypothetical protein